MQYHLLLSQVGRLIERKHEHLLVAVQRYFVVRHFSLHMLKEMRLSKLKALSQTDFRAALMEDPCKSQSCANSTLKVGKMYFYLLILSFKHLKTKPSCKPLENTVCHSSKVIAEVHSRVNTVVVPYQSQNSSASLAERHLGPESQLVGHSFQQEFLSELETGTELLQSHAQLVLGNALSSAIQQLMQTPPTESQTSPKQDDGLKVFLCEDYCINLT